jgi:hypothetical protein
MKILKAWIVVIYSHNQNLGDVTQKICPKGQLFMHPMPKSIILCECGEVKGIKKGIKICSSVYGWEGMCLCVCPREKVE